MFLPSNSKWTHIFLQTVHFHAFKHLFVFDVLGIKSEFMEAANLCICFIYILDAGFGVWVYWFESMHQLWTDMTEQMNRRVLSWMEELQNKSSHFCVSSVLLLGFSRSLRGRTEKLLALKQTFQLIKYSFNSNVFYSVEQKLKCAGLFPTLAHSDHSWAHAQSPDDELAAPITFASWWI